MPDVITGLERGRERLNFSAFCMSSPICGQRRGKNENEDSQECELPFHQDCVSLKHAASVHLEMAIYLKSLAGRVAGYGNRSKIGEKASASSKTAIPRLFYFSMIRRSIRIGHRPLFLGAGFL